MPISFQFHVTPRFGTGGTSAMTAFLFVMVPTPLPDYSVIFHGTFYPAVGRVPLVQLFSSLY